MTVETATFRTIDRARVEKVFADELRTFEREHPQSKKLFEQAKSTMMGGVPMNWMVRWAGAFPVFVKEAHGATFKDVDGKEYVDLCLGDTGAMAGHSPDATVRAIENQIKNGVTLMLPSEDAIWVTNELKERFKLPYWQFALTATDANRFSIRFARKATGRPKILVFNYCYHGTVDETFATIKDGQTVARKSNLGPPVDPALTTRVVEFNDLQALEEALSHGDVACVLAEPVMTNIGIIHPKPGYWEKAQQLISAAGALLIIDETHTISAGPGGYAALNGIQPDILTLGKPIAGGIPAAVYGMSETVMQTISHALNLDDCDVSGIGGTLAGNALSIAATRATLQHVLTAEAYKKMVPLATKFAESVKQVIDEFKLPWSVQQLGCRAEYWFCAKPPENGGGAAAAADPELERLMHLCALNRGILLTPFHNMALMSPYTTPAHIDAHTEVFRASVKQLCEGD